MEKEPLVSVGIPCYNRSEGLRRTLNCITNQTYRNLEIIVSDNCSPDREVEKVGKEFASKDLRVQYYQQTLNKGPISNFQFVLCKATGEYFMWAADDDEWNQDFIENGIKSLIATNATSVFGTVNSINVNTKQIVTTRSPPYYLNNENCEERIFQFLEGSSKNLYTDGLIHCLFKRDIFDYFEILPKMSNAYLFVFRIIGSGPLADCVGMSHTKYIKGETTNKSLMELYDFFGVKPAEYASYRNFGLWQEYHEVMRYISNRNKIKATILFKRRYFSKNLVSWRPFLSLIFRGYVSKKRKEIITWRIHP